MKIIKKIVVLTIGAAVLAGSSLFVNAGNAEFGFTISTPQASPPETKSDTADAVVNTQYISNTSGSVGYAVFQLDGNGNKEYAVGRRYYEGANVLGRKYLSHYSGYAVRGAIRYLEGSRFGTDAIITVTGLWAP